METLAVRVGRDGPMNERDAVGWVIRLAKRVERLHQLGVAHGGISAHVILCNGATCTSRGVLSDVRQAAIRPAYHSPERHAGAGISPEDDVWAMAVTLYVLLTGQRPYSGETSQEIHERITAAAPAPLAVYDVGDDDLQSVLDQFMNRDASARVTRVGRLRALLEAWHPDPAAKDLPPLDEVEEHSDYDDADDEEEIATVMRDFSDVRAQIEAMEADGSLPSYVQARSPRPAAGSGPTTRPPPALVGPARKASNSPARPRIGAQTAMGGFGPNEGDRATPPTAIAAHRAGQPVVTAPAPARPIPPPPAKPIPSPPGKELPAPPAKPIPPPPGGSPAQVGGAVSSVGRPPPAFDIQDEPSEEDVATVLMDPTDLSAEIERALAVTSQPGAPAPPVAPSFPVAAPAEPVAGAAPTSLAPQPSRAPVAPELSLEELLAAQPVDDSGLKRALIVAIVLFVIVGTAVALLWMGQEGMLG